MALGTSYTSTGSLNKVNKLWNRDNPWASYGQGLNQRLGSILGPLDGSQGQYGGWSGFELPDWENSNVRNRMFSWKDLLGGAAAQQRASDARNLALTGAALQRGGAGVAGVGSRVGAGGAGSAGANYLAAMQQSGADVSNLLREGYANQIEEAKWSKGLYDSWINAQMDAERMRQVPLGEQERWYQNQGNNLLNLTNQTAAFNRQLEADRWQKLQQIQQAKERSNLNQLRTNMASAAQYGNWSSPQQRWQAQYDIQNRPWEQLGFL